MTMLDEDFQRRLARYFHDCLAAQANWGHALNVIDQSDVTVLPLAADEQERLGVEGALRLSDSWANDLAKKVLTAGSEATLQLGALFLVGRIPATSEKSERRFCGPVLEVALKLVTEANGEVVITPDEAEFSVNYGMLAELIGGDDDSLQERLEDLAELVPDFPIDASEFNTFWQGFRIIAPELTIDDQLPNARRSDQPNRSMEWADRGKSRTGQPQDRDDHRTIRPAEHNAPLEMIDFFVPTIPREGFRMLPATAVLLGPKTGGSMSALAELRTMERLSLSETAFGCLFDPNRSRQPQYAKSDRAYPDEVLPMPLTPAQAAVVESARSAPLTVVTGPPGTGKSHTIAAIVLDALLHHQTVLVGSQMDKAVEVVADRVETLVDGLAIARSGGRAAQRRLAEKVKALTGPRKRKTGISTESVDQLGRRHYELTRELQELEEQFQRIINNERCWSRARFAHERSHRPDWLADIELSDSALLKVDKLLARQQHVTTENAGFLRRWISSWEFKRLRRILRVPSQQTTSVEDLANMREVHALRQEMRQASRDLKQLPTADTVFNRLASTQRRRRTAGLDLLRQIRSKELEAISGDSNHRDQLRDLATLLRRRKHELKQQLQENITAELVLRAFPAWACTSRSLCEVLPAQPGLFDLVVIDEASQCDLALASVALLRAKRVVVVGDPNQLRRVCFLSRAREQASLASCQIPAAYQDRFSYRRSLFDVAADMVDRQHFFFLDEHFRSHPQIIEFSNRHFYDCDLSIMTRRPSTATQHAIRICQLAGKRDPESSVNPDEIVAIIELIREIVSTATHATDLSIGVVSPFRDQVDAIQERLVREFSAEQISRHSMVVGTAHAFQGDEKDIILFSTSIDAASHPASLRFLESPNLFNVAITRARREMIVVTSVAPEQLPPGLLREYLFYAREGWTSRHPNESPHNELESEIVKQLTARQLPAWPGFEGAGHRIDVATEVDGRCVAIMCDAWNDQLSSPWKVMETHRRLARAGWRVLRVSHRMIAAGEGAWLNQLKGSSHTTDPSPTI